MCRRLLIMFQIPLAAILGVICVFGCGNATEYVFGQQSAIFKPSILHPQLEQETNGLSRDSEYVTDDQFAELQNFLASLVTGLTWNVRRTRTTYEKQPAMVSYKRGNYNAGIASIRTTELWTLYLPIFGGEMNGFAFCPMGTLATGFRIQLQSDQGSGDDTGMNNLELQCSDVLTNEQVTTVRSGTGPFGSWREWQMCNPGDYLVAFRLKVKEWALFDDVSYVNGITMRCRKYGTIDEEYTLTGPIGGEGQFIAWSNACLPYHAICGVNAAILPDQGNKDDVGLSDIRFLCCI